LRGHHVTLYEKASKLGGLLPIASTIKGTDIEDLPGIIRYLAKQIADLGVDIKLGQEATPAMIEGMKPDAVIVAAGSLPATPQIAGFSKPIVVSNYTLHKTLKFYLRFLSPKMLGRLTKFWMPLGKSVIVMGGDIQGCQLAEFLVKRGRKVTIVEEGGEQDLGRNMQLYKKQKLIPWLREKGVRILTDVTYREITDFGLTITIPSEAMPKGEIKESSAVRMIQCIKADNIISVLPSKPNTDFVQSLKGKVPEIYAVGDAREPKLIIDAIADGSLTARKI
jgi:2,4-dienoyl-CoA reductase (NADPH2)